MKKNSGLLGTLPHITAFLAAAFLTGCSKFELLNPAGSIGETEKTIILTAFSLMLIVVIPVIIMALVFAWRYRENNKDATYTPEWSHSTKIEVFVWLIPAIIVIALGTIVWISSHRLDPYRPIESKVKAIEVEVVSLDWKWLFIYPEHNIATVNELVFPANTPVHFRITSSAVMNSFFIPQLGSQIYAMPGMRTQLNLIANREGTYNGLSANYSGRGFSDMHFKAIATSNEEFSAWVAKTKLASKKLDQETYDQLELPSEKNPVETYSAVEPNLFDNILHKNMPMSRHAATGEGK